MEVNPDRRPLPDGWTQHYESSTQLWYYIQTNVIPPKVSSTHPLDAGPSNSRRKSKRVSHMSSLNLGLYSPSASMEMPQSGGFSSSSMSMSLPQVPNMNMTIPTPPQPRMSRAQELYASSASKATVPMISTNDIQSFSTAPNPALQSAISPLSSHPAVSGGRPLPGASSSHFQLGNTSVHSLHEHHAPHRTQSLQQMRPPHELHRAQTFSPGHGFNPHSKQYNGPRTLTTKAAPPSRLNQNVPLALKTNGAPAPPMPTPLSPLRLNAEIPPSTPLTTPSPPTSSVLFSNSPSSAGTPLTSPPPMSPPISSPQSAPPFTTPSTVSHQPALPVHNTGMLPPRPPAKPAVAGNPAMLPPPPKPSLANQSVMLPPPPPKPATTNASAMYPPTATSNNNAGRLAVGAMFKLAGGIFAATTGSSSSSGIFNAVGNFVSNPTIFNTLTSAFAKNNTGVSDAELQAVMQAKPGANYQGVINALMQQHQAYQRQSAAYAQSHPGMVPPPPSVNYQMLIQEVQRLQQLSQQQHSQQPQAQAGLQPHQLQQLAQQQQTHQWVQQQQLQQASQHVAPQQHHQQQLPQQPQQQGQHFVPQQPQQNQYAPHQPAQATVPQQQPFTHQQAPYTAQAQPNQMQQQQAPFQAQATPQPPQQQQQQHQQQPQNGQNCYMQALHTMEHLYQEMSDQQQQQNEQQDQQQQQQQPQQVSVTETYDFNYSFGGNNSWSGQQQQQFQQPPASSNANSGMGYDPSQPTFDPSTLYIGDPNNTPGSAGGGGLLDALGQTLGVNSGGGQADGTGMVALLSGVNEALNPLNNLGQGGIDLGLGNNNNSW